MIIAKDGNIAVVSQENSSFKAFMTNLKSSYNRLENGHIIIDLSIFSMLTVEDVHEFLPLSNVHRAARKSFVLVTNVISYDDVPQEICLVPSITEAKDIIEMEDIERDLDV
jgi:hypothetical protein